jgi:hypothetical protein
LPSLTLVGILNMVVMLLWVLSHKQIQLPLYAFLQLIRYITVGTTLHVPLCLTWKSPWLLATSLLRLKEYIFLVNIFQILKDRCFWKGSQLSSILDKDERGRLVEFMWSDFIIYVKWVTVHFLGIKVSCTWGWSYTEGTWLYCDYFIWVYLVLCLF